MCDNQRKIESKTEKSYGFFIELMFDICDRIKIECLRACAMNE